MKKETQSQEIKRLAKQYGRKLYFVHKTLDMFSPVFYQCMKRNSFTPEEMQDVRNIIINGVKLLPQTEQSEHTSWENAV